MHEKDIHPESRLVAFVDRAADFVVIVNSTLKTQEMYEHEGVIYPCMYIETSSVSHPFYAGQKVLLKTSSIDKFYVRQKKAQKLSK